MTKKKPPFLALRSTTTQKLERRLSDIKGAAKKDFQRTYTLEIFFGDNPYKRQLKPTKPHPANETHGIAAVQRINSMAS